MNTNYLKWDAQSIQQLLRRKLLEQGVYTDQMYPGSDTKIILDLFAWTFDVLTYILNNNASDSLFSDTMLYENMNRLVKLLSYNPDGYHTANAIFRIAIQNDLVKSATQVLPDNCVIPKFTSIDIGKTDSNGNTIKYSFISDYSFSVYNTTYGTDSTIITPDFWPILYNGEFKKYTTVFRANGIPYDSFLLNDLDYKNNIYVDHDCFHIYIETLDEQTGQSIYQEWNKVDNLVLDSNATGKDYEIRLNENKIYVLTFGDNIHGKKLNDGDKIHIVYLQSNIEQGKIQNGQISVDAIDFKVTGFANNTEFINMCFGGLTLFKRKYKGLFVQNNIMKESCSKLVLSNIRESTQPTTFESVDDIRINAPAMFRMGNRLVTVEDYRNYFLIEFNNLIQDVWVCNNTTYMTIFYQWLYKYDKLTAEIRKYYYLFSDTCDFNNIYAWIKSKTKSDLTEIDMNSMVANCNRIKAATVQIVPCNAIIKYFIPYVDHPDYPLSISDINFSDWNPTVKIRVRKKAQTYFTNSQAKEDINNIITEYFKIENQTLGNNIQIDQLYNKIMALGYIESVKTVYIPQTNTTNEYSVAGLSFACFCVKIINGEDLEIVKYNEQLLPFQFAQLYTEDITNFIEIQNTDTFSLINSGF